MLATLTASLTTTLGLGTARVDALRAMRSEGRVVVSPSVAKADFFRLGEDLRGAVDAGAEWLHFSVQDGRMVPKISFGAPVIASLRPHFPYTVFDVKVRARALREASRTACTPAMRSACIYTYTNTHAPAGCRSRPTMREASELPARPSPR